MPTPERLLALQTDIDAWVRRYHPDAVAIERVFADVNVASVMGKSAVFMRPACRPGKLRHVLGSASEPSSVGWLRAESRSIGDRNHSRPPRSLSGNTWRDDGRKVSTMGSGSATPVLSTTR